MKLSRRDTSIYQWLKKNVSEDEAVTFDWMLEHADRFVDERAGELDEEALVHAWDTEGREDGATIDEARDAAHKLSVFLKKGSASPRLARASRASEPSSMYENIRGHNVMITGALIPGSGRSIYEPEYGFKADLDFIYPHLATYGRTRRETIQQAERDIIQWESGGWENKRGRR